MEHVVLNFSSKLWNCCSNIFVEESNWFFYFYCCRMFLNFHQGWFIEFSVPKSRRPNIINHGFPLNSIDTDEHKSHIIYEKLSIPLFYKIKSVTKTLFQTWKLIHHSISYCEMAAKATPFFINDTYLKVLHPFKCEFDYVSRFPSLFKARISALKFVNRFKSPLNFFKSDTLNVFWHVHIHPFGS